MIRAQDCLYECDLCGETYLKVPWDYDRERCPTCCARTGVALPSVPAGGRATLGETVGAVLVRSAAIGEARRRVRGAT
jgi:hypothetical protein